MRRIALVFPGQASQYRGMGQALYKLFPEAREVFDEADSVLDGQASELCFNGSDADLALTENTQPAILTVSVAAFRVLASRGVEVHAVAGHSLGEYSALVAAGGLAFADAVQLVRNRGRYMQAAVPVGQGAMAAILGLDAKAVIDLCEEAARGEIVVAANYNSPEQTVVAGDADAVRRAVALGSARGAKRAVMLPVSAPFHSPLMQQAKERLAVDLGAISFSDLKIPVVTNVDAAYVRKGSDARQALERQMTAAVRWTESVTLLATDGVGTFVEVGPGKVLSGLIRRIQRGAEILNVEDPTSFEATMAILGTS